MIPATRTGVPVGLVWMNGRPVVTLRDLPPGGSYQPFWDHTLRQATGRPGLLPLDRAPDPPHEWRPAGSIFHMQRCGSTLACHLLGALPGVMALSEPMIFQLLFTGPGSVAERRVWLRRLMALHATSLCPAGEALVVKWSSVSLVFEAEIAAAFPGVPAVFSYRDPLEVLMSCLDGVPQLVRRLEPRFFAPHLRPDSHEQIRSWPLAELLVRYHASCCYHAARADAMRLLEYQALPAIVWEKLADHFGLETPSAAALERVRQRARLDVKDPEQERVFEPDGERKRAAASADIRVLVERFVRPELEALRTRHAAL
jgi:hypothetical protein